MHTKLSAISIETRPVTIPEKNSSLYKYAYLCDLVLESIGKPVIIRV